MASLQLEESRHEIQKRDQEMLAMSAKMKTLEEQHQDYQRHIMVLKESLSAKEEHYNMLQADVSTVGTANTSCSPLGRRPGNTLSRLAAPLHEARDDDARRAGL